MYESSPYKRKTGPIEKLFMYLLVTIAYFVECFLQRSLHGTSNKYFGWYLKCQIKNLIFMKTF